MFGISNILLYTGLVVICSLLVLRQEDTQVNTALTIMQYIASIADFSIPLITSSVALFLASVSLSGFQYSSSITRDMAKKVSWIFAIWTGGRFVRGTCFLLFLQNNWDQLDSTIQSIIQVTIIGISELLPLIFLFEWDVVGIFLLGNDEATFSYSPGKKFENYLFND
jgi:hypothetical protein